MKNTLLILASAGLLVACSSSGNPASTITPAATATIAPTPLTGCSPVDAQATIEALQRIEAELAAYDDAAVLAETTSRIGLAPVISDMQGARRVVERLDVPACANSIVSGLAEGMSAIIDGLIAFQDDQPAIVVADRMKVGQIAFDRFGAKLTDLRTDARPDPTATAAP